MDGKSLDIELCEITGREGYDYLRPQSYGRADVVILCYSVISLTSFNSIRSKWFPEVSERCPESQYILAGTNAHLREHGDSSPEPGSHDTNFVTTVDGYQMAKDLGLAGYTECSYLTGEGLDDLFEMAGGHSILQSQTLLTQHRLHEPFYGAGVASEKPMARLFQNGSHKCWNRVQHARIKLT